MNSVEEASELVWQANGHLRSLIWFLPLETHLVGLSPLHIISACPGNMLGQRGLEREGPQELGGHAVAVTLGVGE